MKKQLLSGIMAAAVFASGIQTNATAGPFDFMGGDKKDTQKTEKAVDLNALSGSALRLILSVGKATLEFADASVVMLLAIGKKAEAEKLKAVIEEAKKNSKDPEKMKTFITSEETTGAFKTLANADLGAKTNQKMSQDDLINSFMKIGAGLMMDGLAVKDAGNLVQEATSLIDTVKADPMKYGLSAIGTVNSVISSGKFIGDNVPKQVEHLKGFSDKMITYFKTNKISIPSPEKIQKFTSDLQKE